MCKVSIIMGIYNCASTLSEAIESIMGQSYTDWELIMCDDGSVDDTYEVALNHKRMLGDRVILLKNEKNMGLNYTLNRCLAKASGDYVARMDGDDLSLHNRLEREVEFLDSHPEYAIVSTPMIFFDENGDWGRNYMVREPIRSKLFKYNPIFCHAACMIRREAYMEVNGYTENPHMIRCEDLDLWYKLYAKGYRGYNLEEPLYKMRDDFSAARRRGLKYRLNIVYVMFVGFKALEYPWYMYTYVALELMKQMIKGLIPESIYIKLHQKNVNRKVD